MGVKGLRANCEQCGHRWIRKDEDKLPLKCPNPKCQSPNWNRKKKD